MIEYPKIETLYDRDPKTFKVYPTMAFVRLPEFRNIKRWHITEKVDGTNIRVGITGGKLEIGGRTDNAQIPPHLLKYLQAAFDAEQLTDVFSGSDAVLFGEGYGPKIQKGGGNYRADVSFRLFDVRVGEWWLEPNDIADVARKLGIKSVPYIETIESLPESAKELAAIFVDSEGGSHVAYEDEGTGLQAEGIIARAAPMLLTRKGERLMWKLKFKDF